MFVCRRSGFDFLEETFDCLLVAYLLVEGVSRLRAPGDSKGCLLSQNIIALLAQSVEHQTLGLRVAGSAPPSVIIGVCKS